MHVQVHTDLFAPEYRRHSFLNRIRAAIARFVLRRAARVRVVSGRIKRDLESLLRLRVPITVLPIFADAERFRYALPDPDLQERFAGYAHRLLVVSRLEPEKAVERAIRAFSEEAPENSCLVIVGEGRLRRELQEYAASVRRGRHIFFEGARDPAPYYKMADVVLVTSEYEGYGLVIAEALAAGTPVIAGDVGAARELGAIVAPPERYGEALAEWFQRGPREGRLLGYPYRDFQAYVRAYCDDIAACVQTQK